MRSPWAWTETVDTNLLSAVRLMGFAGPEEVADVVTFLASPRAGYVMGVNSRVDGGWTGTVT